MMRRRIVLFCVVMTLAAANRAAAQKAALADVLERAGEYVAGFERQLSGIVAEEWYTQDVLASAKERGCARAGTYSAVLNCREAQLVYPVHAELRADLLLVRPTGASSWTEFRDVFESNGRPVRDREERLTKLFLNDAPSGRQQISRILDESSRFNIGEIARNINTPLFALQILEAANRPRFKFKRASSRPPATFTGDDAPTAAFRVAIDVWIVEYEETRAGTLIKTEGLKDLPARGRFWIEPDSGRVLMSELQARQRGLRATIDVSYQSEPLLGCLVPIEMREDYQDRRGAHITAHATYGRFRQFQVNVDEKFMPVVKR
jgi:hypothetical protein